MTTAIAPAPPPPKKLRRKDFPKDANLCEHCTAKCCRYFALPIETPTELDDFLTRADILAEVTITDFSEFVARALPSGQFIEILDLPA